MSVALKSSKLMEYKYDVFISCSRKDSKIADEIYNVFINDNIVPFIDRQRILCGENRRDRLAEAIVSSRLFLFLGSYNSYVSVNVKNELDFACDYKDKSDLIPYIIDGSDLPAGGIGFCFASIHKLYISTLPVGGALVNTIRQKLKDFSNSKITYPTKNNEMQKSEVKSGDRQVPSQQVPENLVLSYFTGEKHSKDYEQIIQLAEGLGYSVRVYESTESSQFDFLQAVYRDTATIVDATIPDDLSLSTVYPLLTAHVNILDHVLVFSDNLYVDGTQILPLNIVPQRARTKNDKDLLVWLGTQLKKLGECQYYNRFEIESIEKLADYKKMMEEVMSVSLELHKPKEDENYRVMISYRNSCKDEVVQFKEREEARFKATGRKVEIVMLPPGSLCGDYEAHTPMRRWMLVGLLEDHIRSVKEVWVYYNDIYANSWWTLAEMVMVAYVNSSRAEKDKVKVKVYDAAKKRFIEEAEDGYPSYLHIHLSDPQRQKLARCLSNTRPDVMGPEMLDQVRKLKMAAWVMRFMTKKRREFIAGQMQSFVEQSIPSDLSKEEHDSMVKGLLAIYSDPKAMMNYANDPVFKDKFWNNISYQTGRVTGAFKNGAVDVDAFIDTPMRELTKFKDEDLCEIGRAHV